MPSYVQVATINTYGTGKSVRTVTGTITVPQPHNAVGHMTFETSERLTIVFITPLDGEKSLLQTLRRAKKKFPSPTSYVEYSGHGCYSNHDSPAAGGAHAAYRPTSGYVPIVFLKTFRKNDIVLDVQLQRVSEDGRKEAARTPYELAHSLTSYRLVIPANLGAIYQSRSFEEMVQANFFDLSEVEALTKDTTDLTSFIGRSSLQPETVLPAAQVASDAVG